MQMVLLKDVANEITVGFVGSMANEYIEEGIPFLRSLNILPLRIEISAVKFISPTFHKKLKKSALKPGDVVIVRTGKPGTCTVIPDDLPEANCSDIVIVRCGPRIRPHFLAYWVNTVSSEHVASHLVGAVQQHFNVGAARQIPIRLPSLEIQDDVLSILRALDDKIELNRKTATTLEEMARALYRSWFVDFDPVHARSQGNTPAHMDQTTAALFPDSFGDDGLPKGWIYAKLSDFMTFRGGSQPSAAQFLSSPRKDYVRLIQIRDFYTMNHPTYIPDTDKLRKISEDDICIGRYGSGSGDKKDSLGRLCRGLEGAINVALVRVEPKFDCREFLATYIGCGAFQVAISGGSARAVQAGFRKDDLDTIEIPRAPDSVHAAFEKFGNRVWDKTKLISRENQTLATLRDTLLPRLMSGELRVGDAREQVKEVV
jgi:type I restriction enzyme S subunit